MSKKYVKSCFSKQAFWQVNITPPKVINHPHYNETKPNKQHQFNLIYVPQNVFEGNTYRYTLTGVELASK